MRQKHLFMCLLLPFIVFSSQALGVKLRNFRQIEGKLSAATGTPSSNYNVRAVANQFQGLLPVDSSVEGFSGSSVRAASALAAAYCMQGVYRESGLLASERTNFRFVNFDLPVEGQSDEAVQETIVALASSFWMRQPAESEMSALTATAKRFRSSLPQGDRRFTKLFYGALCTAVGSSLESLVIREN